MARETGAREAMQDQDTVGLRGSAWSWIPSVYFAQGLQYSVIVQVFAIVFFTMGVSAGDTLFWIGAVSLPWTFKPLWGPLVDKYGTKRAWTWVLQLLMGACFVLAAGGLLLGDGKVLGLPLFMLVCVLVLAVAAFCAATHDIACDGFYMLGLSEKKQAFFVGIRSVSFQLAMMFANGVLVWMAGSIQAETGLPSVQSAVQVSQSVAVEDLYDLAPWPDAGGEEIQIMPRVLRASPGDAAHVTIRLSAPPPEDTPRVVTLNTAGKVPGISVPRDHARLVFTAENWDQGVDVPLEIDPRLAGENDEVIEAKAGNIPISWSAAVLVAGLIFIGVGAWHRFILPRPAMDAVRSDSGGLPRFLTAAGWLGLTVLVPLAAVWLAGSGIGLLKGPIRSAVIGEVASPALQDIREHLQPGDGVAAAEGTETWRSITAVRDAAPELGASGLEAATGIRRMLRSAGVADDPARLELLAANLHRVRIDPEVYGNASLRHLLILTTNLNEGVVPRSEAEFRAVLDKASSPALGVFDGEDWRSGMALLAAVEEASGGSLPGSRQEFDALLEQARATPTRLMVKGFDSLFSVCRVLLLVALAFAVVRIPALWRPVRAAAWRASEASGIGFAEVFATFLAKPGIAATLGFLLTYRLGESQLSQVKNVFLLDGRDGGGLGLSLGDVALINSTTYLGLLTVGSLLGGMLIARIGLRRSLWPMVALMHLPNLLYLWLSMTLPTASLPIHFAVGLESFGHGFGFAAYLVIMMIAAQGPYKTAHYALCTGAMALGNMIPGMWAGYLQELVGYNTFFLLVMVFTIPGTVLIPFLKLDMSFGSK